MVISPSKWFHYHILIDVATIYAIECVLTHININIHKYISKNDGFTIRNGDLTIKIVISLNKNCGFGNEDGEVYHGSLR